MGKREKRHSKVGHRTDLQSKRDCVAEEMMRDQNRGGKRRGGTTEEQKLIVGKQHKHGGVG